MNEDTVLMAHAGIERLTQCDGDPRFERADRIADAIPAFHRIYADPDRMDLCVPADQYFGYMLGIMNRLPEWLRGGLMDARETQIHRRLALLPRKTAG